MLRKDVKAVLARAMKKDWKQNKTNNNNSNIQNKQTNNNNNKTSVIKYVETAAAPQARTDSPAFRKQDST